MPAISKSRISKEKTAELIRLLGGASETARIFGVHRNAPYGWLRDGLPDYRFDQLRIKKPDIVVSLLEGSRTE